MSVVAATAVWERVGEALRQRVPPRSYDTWFARARLRPTADGGFELGVASRFIKSWIDREYRALLEELLADAVATEADAAPRLAIVIDPELFQALREEQAAPVSVPEPDFARPAPLRRDLEEDGPLPEGAVFGRFVEGSGNRLAFRAAEQAAARPGRFPLLWLHGAHATGKTHLLQAACRAARDAGRRAQYWTAERFTAAFGAAVAAKELPAFRQRVDAAALLAFDDAHVFARGKKDATLEEWRRALDAARGRGATVLLAADAADAERFPAGLASRLAAAVALPLEASDRAFATELARRCATERGLEPPEAVVAVLAEAGDARAVEGAAAKFAALVELGGFEPTVTTARLALGPDARPGARTLTAEDVIAATAAEFGLPPETLTGRSRERRARRARGVAAALARKLTGASLAELGRHFGGRTHATMLSLLGNIPASTWGDGADGRPAARILAALGRYEAPAELFPAQGDLFAADGDA